jgi:internalin A
MKSLEYLNKQGRYHTAHKTVNGMIAVGLCFLAVISILLSGRAYAAGGSPEQGSAADSTASGQRGGELHAFYPSTAVFSDQMKKYIDEVDSLSFAWSRIDSEEPGTLNTVKGKNGNTGFYYPADYMLPVEYAKSEGKTIQLNVYMDRSDCIRLLPYPEMHAVMIKAIMDSLQTEIVSGTGITYDGTVIDFEGLRDTDSQGKQLLYEGKPISTYFLEFLTELKAELSLQNKKLYVAVNSGLNYDGYDYGDILDIADRVILMAHDYEPLEKLQKQQVEQYTGYDALEPVYSMAPIQLVRQALNEMSENASDASEMSKLWLQITFDSAQWQFDVKNAEGFQSLSKETLSREGRVTPLYKSIKDRVDNKDGKGQNIGYGYNQELQTPYLQYYNSADKSWNVILYEDSLSIGAKMDLADAYGLGGISLWSLANVPDYTDSTGRKYHLDGWTTILDKMDSFGISSAKYKKTVTIKDDAIEQAIREKLGKPTGKLTAFDLQGIYRLQLPQGVKSLTDLKLLPQLEYLGAQKLGLKDISALGSLKKLRVLYLQRNQITDISVLKKLTKLEVLSLNGNLIKNISPLSGLTTLKKLYLRENKITGITQLTGLKNLKELYLGGNLIKDYSPVKQIVKKAGFQCDFKIG